MSYPVDCWFYFSQMKALSYRVLQDKVRDSSDIVFTKPSADLYQRTLHGVVCWILLQVSFLHLCLYHQYFRVVCNAYISKSVLKQLVLLHSNLKSVLLLYAVAIMWLGVNETWYLMYLWCHLLPDCCFSSHLSVDGGDITQKHKH